MANANQGVEDQLQALMDAMAAMTVAQTAAANAQAAAANAQIAAAQAAAAAGPAAGVGAVPVGVAAPAGLGPGRRLAPYNQIDSIEWLTWRRTFLLIAEAAGWNEAQKKIQAAACMEGPAATVVSHIDTAALATVAEVLDAYEACLMPAAAGEVAQQEFEVARQLPGESLLAWHSRLRTLFIRAYANVVPETAINLRNKFSRGLIDPKIRLDVMNQRPQGYQEALTIAQRFHSNKIMNEQFIQQDSGLNGDAHKVTVLKGDEIDAMGNRNPGWKGKDNKKDVCWFCNRDGHQKRNCHLWKKAEEEFAKKKDGKKNGHDRKGKDDRGDKKKPRGKGRGRVNAMDDESADEDYDTEN